MTLSYSTFGPFFKVTCTPSDLAAPTEADLVGVLEARGAGRPRPRRASRGTPSSQGFIAPPPFGILHLDSVRVYNSRLRGDLRARAQSAFGLALLIGSVAFLCADAQGCTRAELLAIDDGNEYAERLVRYYARLGFAPVRAIGSNGLRDLPDLLVWGGAGMRMDADIKTLIKRWTRALRRSPGAAAQST